MLQIASMNFKKSLKQEILEKNAQCFAYCTTAEMHNQNFKAWEISMNNPKSS